MIKKIIPFLLIIIFSFLQAETNTIIGTNKTITNSNINSLYNSQNLNNQNIDNKRGIFNSKLQVNDDKKNDSSKEKLIKNDEELEKKKTLDNLESEELKKENKEDEKDIEKELQLKKLNAYEELIEKHSYKRQEAELFGRDIFNRPNSSLSLPSELEVGKDYVLSSGDVIKVNLLGDTLPAEMQQQSYNISITLSGNLSIPTIGSFNVRGKTLLEVEKEANKKGRTKYKDIKVEISLAKMRSVRVFVMGEVVNPGTYTLNPLSNLINAIYLAGGMTKNSSIRNIKILRKNKTIKVDLYEYLLKGNTKDNALTLSEGDTIFIPVLNKKVSVEGNVKRSYTFELKDEKTISDMIELAGGVNNLADLKDLKIIRVDKSEKVKIAETKDLTESVKNADILIIGKINDQVSNGINIIGNVQKPGIYEKQSNEKLSQIIERAGGFLPDTYFERVDILRLEGDTKYAKYSYSLKKDNPEIQPGDTVFVYSLSDVGVVDYVTVKGAVTNPGVYKIYKNSKIVDAIFMAKGVNQEDVYLQRADVLRLEEDGTTTVIKINLRKAIAGDETQNIELKAFDTVKVYANTDVDEKKYVQVMGAVRNPGTYVLNNNNNKVSDIVFEAKGLQEKDVYLKRAVVFRVDKSGDIQMINVNLKDALNKTSENNTKEDLQLLPYDVLKIYTYDEVRDDGNIYVYGEVKAPGKYQYFKNMTLDDLIFLSKQSTMMADLRKIEIYRFDKVTKTKLKLEVNYYEDPNFLLQEEDHVFIRKNKEFESVKIVKVTGYVKYPGEYMLEKNDNVNDIIKRAGGFKERAFPQGVKIIRNEDLNRDMDRLNKRVALNVEATTISALQLKTEKQNDVEITNLLYNSEKKFFENAILLKSGDEIVIPSIPTTVKIVGEVYFPREIGYESGNSSFDYYIQAAGGLTEKAYEKRIFVIKADGKVQKSKKISKMKIGPGDTIVVPYDYREEKKFNLFKDSLQFFQWLVTVMTAYKLIDD